MRNIVKTKLANDHQPMTRSAGWSLHKLLLSCMCVPLISIGAEPKTCNEATELECVKSAECTLVQAEARGKYTCRAAVGRCEIGFRQVAETDIKKECESKAGCEFIPASCFCPPIPGLSCTCGGGPPAQCVERRGAK